MAPSILVIEKDEPQLRLMQWALRDAGFDVAPLQGPPESVLGLKPQLIVLNTGMALQGKRVWIESLRYLVPGVHIVDLVSNEHHGADYDSGADGYLYPPFRIDELGTIMIALLKHDPRTASGSETS